ncbi:hypothetical protein AGOR_G00175330 [Albula goreensis]|uniref:XK-related protein n=1 Tax=Albula goreensis TaxID=1534307 RepID=A0A8T3CXS8_9TELE|nr:hypothetical protein AGOR_G00175330 [Albula goreensis]
MSMEQNLSRYFQLLKKGVKAIKSNNSPDHREVFAMGTDLSMLRLFESFLESAPQLLLQLYIILNYNQTSITQYICIIGSVLSIAWATVEYRRCFRRSLARVKDMPSGVPTAVYLLYKFFTISSRSTIAGLLCLLVFYAFLHPKSERPEADEVDGQMQERLHKTLK